MRFRIARRELDGFSKLSQRFVGLAEHQKHATELGVGRCELGIELDRLPKLGGSLFEHRVARRRVVVGGKVRPGDGDPRESDERSGVFGGKAERLSVFGFGGGKVIRFECGVARLKGPVGGRTGSLGEPYGCWKRSRRGAVLDRSGWKGARGRFAHRYRRRSRVSGDRFGGRRGRGDGPRGFARFLGRTAARRGTCARQDTYEQRRDRPTHVLTRGLAGPRRVLATVVP